MNKSIQIILLIIAFAGAFLIGFIPPHLKYKACDQAIQALENSCNEQSLSKDQEISLLKDKLYFEDIKNTITASLIELEKSNYGTSLDKYKVFIEKWENFKSNKLLQGKITDADIMRDEIVADLAKNNAKVKDKIIAIIEKFHSINL